MPRKKVDFLDTVRRDMRYGLAGAEEVNVPLDRLLSGKRARKDVRVHPDYKSAEFLTRLSSTDFRLCSC